MFYAPFKHLFGRFPCRLLGLCLFDAACVSQIRIHVPPASTRLASVRIPQRASGGQKRVVLADPSNVREQLRPDAYLLYGAEYTDIRTTWNDFIQQNSPKEQADLFVGALRAAIGRVKQPALRPLLSLLSLNRTLLSDERGLANFEPFLREGNQQVVQTLVEAFEGTIPPNVATDILHDVLPRGVLQTFAQTFRANDDVDRGLREIEAHFQLVALLLSHSPALLFLGPLVSLALDATPLQNVFLPTMPSDEMFRSPLGYSTFGRENLTYYMCPNGHAFPVGEYGQPRASSHCRTCNLPIGMGAQNLPLNQP